MSVSIIHLSDIHVRAESGISRRDAERVVAASMEFIKSSDSVVLAVTGDIAFSGKRTEYDRIKDFIHEISNKVRELNRRFYIALCPGNHDCDFSGSQAVRDVLINDIKKDITGVISPEIVDVCLSVQAEYRSFSEWCDELSDDFHSQKSGRVYDVRSIIDDNEIIEFCCLNAAWMSQINESQGELSFPFVSEIDLDTDVSIRVGLIHHPLNWYAQSHYHPLREFVRSKLSLLLSGHEHSQGATVQIDSGERETIFFESAALFPSGGEQKSGFGVLRIDVSEGLLESRQFGNAGGVYDLEDERNIAINTRKLRGDGQLEVSKEFISVLKDPGGSFSKNGVSIDDIESVYVYPDMLVCGQDDVSETVSSDRLLDESFSSKSIVLGDEKSGRTALLGKIFSDFYRQGKYPIYIDALSIGSVSSDSLKKEINSSFRNQYCVSSDANYFNLPPDKMCFLVDNVNQVRGGIKNVAPLLRFLDGNSDHILCTADEAFSLGEIIGKDIATVVSNFRSFKMQPFGKALRLKLVRKWFGVSFSGAVSDLDRKVYEANRLLNVVVGKSFVPATPFYLLILMQSVDLNDSKKLVDAGLSDYYHYLIVKGLSDAGVSSDEHDEIFNYIACMAWEVRNSEDYYLTEHQARDFNSRFCDKYTKVDFKERTDVLVRARIIVSSSSGYYFRYPYEYYYFLGKYMGARDDSEIHDYIKACLNSLNKKRSSDTILFYLYHSKNSPVIQGLISAISGSFGQFSEFDFSKDARGVDGLVDSVSSIRLAVCNPDARQLEVADMEDQAVSNGAGDHSEDFDLPDDELSSDENMIRNFYLLSRVSEILGQAVTVYYGSMERDVKQKCIGEILSGYLRFIGALAGSIQSNIDEFAESVATFLLGGENADGGADDVRKRAVAFQFACAIFSGFIIKSVSSVSSPRLFDDVSALCEGRGESYKLIRMAHWLSRPAPIPLQELKQLAREVRDNKSAYQALRGLVIYRLSMYHATPDMKQAALDLLDISESAKKALTLESRTLLD